MVPFISWGAKLVQYSELTHYHLNQGSEFPNIKSLQCKFWVKCAGHCVDRSAFLRLCAEKIEEKQRLSARCAPMGCRTRASVSKSLGKIPDRFLPNLWWICCYVGRLRPVSEPASELNQQESKWSPNEGGIYTFSPVWSPICFHSFRRCVSKKWVLTCLVGLC